MRRNLVPIPHIPRAPLGRRGAALAIDFMVAWMLSALWVNLQVTFFLPTWWILRVAFASKNQGQSLGRYALDIKVVDSKFKAVPGLLELSKREAITGLGALAILIGTLSLNPGNAWVILLPLPLLADCLFAWVDPDQRQAYHDRVAGTIVVQTRRGYSLDIKLKRLIAEARHRVK